MLASAYPPPRPAENWSRELRRYRIRRVNAMIQSTAPWIMHFYELLTRAEEYLRDVCADPRHVRTTFETESN